MASQDMGRVATRRWEPEAGGSFSLAAFTAWGHLGDFPLSSRQTIGRMGGSPQAQLQLPSQLLSATHGELAVTGACCSYRDLGSTNGTLLNGERTEGVVTLAEGDSLGFAPGSDPAAVALVLALVQTRTAVPTWQQVTLGEDVQEVLIGRTSGLRLSDEYVSERHASLFQSSSGLMLLDLGSTNGVFLNGRRVEGAAPVAPLDVMRVGSTVIVHTPGELWICRDEPEAQPQAVTPAASRDPQPAPTVPVASQKAPQVAAMATQPAGSAPLATPTGSRLAIDIVQKSVWNRFRSKTLLRDFHLTVEPGDLVLVLGGSGAGKSTFFNAVMGNDPAEGTIRYGDLDVYEEYDQIRHQIGYVPQQDLLRLNDTVWDTLLAAAQLRMPRRTPLALASERARWAAELLGLSREYQTLVGRLSGGQRKRLSIAVELVGDPALFFLDEPDSGLDGIMARSLMESLRSIADIGKMVLVISHGPDRAADLFSKVLVLAKSERDGAGHMAFWGTPAEAREHFGTQDLEGIVRRINRVDEGGEGLADVYIDRWEGR